MEKRLESLDALRGFDMLWITGLGLVASAIGAFLPGGKESWLAVQMEHVPWDGLHLMDMVYPLFIFIAGISFPFSLAKQRERGEPALKIHLKVVKRAALLVFLGLVYNGSLSGVEWPFRCASVLGRIGLTWAFAALIYMHTGLKGRIAAIAGLLLAYGTALVCCGWEFLGSIDKYLTPGSFYEGAIFEPSGVTLSICSIGTALLGMCAGDVVRSSRGTGERKTFLLLGIGAVLLIVGLSVSGLVPINKRLWSPTFTLVVGGVSYLLFALFYWLIDVRGWRRWSVPLQWVGLNAIALYFAHGLFSFGGVTRKFVGILAAQFATPDLTIALGHLALTLLIARFLARRKIFFKV